MSDPKWFAVIGSPVAHSKSPKLHEAAYRALGLPHAYERVETSEADLPARIEALRAGKYSGLNVTVPHKMRVLAYADEQAGTVLAIGAANTLVRLPDGRIRAHNTDAPALAAELARVAGREGSFEAKTGLVLGTGGAARAAIAAFGALGIRRVVVRGRDTRADLGADFERVLAASAHSPEALATTSIVMQPLEARPIPDLAAIVQATTCGMAGGPSGELVAGAVAWDTVPAGAVGIDAVYAPPDTPFLREARQRSIACDNGLGMLARQGALAFELWLGVPAPLDAMLAALGQRSSSS